MRGPYVRAAIMAEIKRARREGRPVDIDYLKEETSETAQFLSRVVFCMELDRYGTPAISRLQPRLSSEPRLL
jgi:hypothetical protein